MAPDLTGQTAIVTGAAHGIGLEIARQLSSAGASVVVADIDEAAAKEAAGQLTNATAIACDVRDEEQVKSLVESTVATYGGLQVMIPNAGIASVAPIVEMDLAAWRKVTSINFDGVFLAIRYAAPAIIASFLHDTSRLPILNWPRPRYSFMPHGPERVILSPTLSRSRADKDGSS